VLPAKLKAGHYHVLADVENSQYDDRAAQSSEQPETAEAGPVALVGRLKPEIARSVKIHAGQAQNHFARLALAAQKKAALVKQLS
jgi:hypothetical protein